MAEDFNKDDSAYLSGLSRTQVLVTIGLIGAPVSILIGGTPLSIASLICSIIAFSKMRKLKSRTSIEGSIERRLYIQAIVGIVVSSIATIINLVFFIRAFTELLNAYNSGTLDQFMNSMGLGSSGGSSSSVWNA